MHADLDTLCTAVYCTADDLLPTPAGNARRRVTDAEVVTLCVAQAIMGIPSDRRFLAVAEKRLCHLFPALPAQPGFHMFASRRGCSRWRTASSSTTSSAVRAAPSNIRITQGYAVGMTKQIAVKLPDELVGELDRLVERGAFDSRSQAVRTGLEAMVGSYRRQDLDQRYRDAITRFPETDEEIGEATRLAVDAIRNEQWERWW